MKIGTDLPIRKETDGNYMLMHNRTSDPTGPQLRAEKIYHALRNRICTNRLPPDTILREEEFAQEFSVSRSPIRRVFAKLEHEGLVEVKHGVGTRVTAIDEDALVGIYKVRMMLAVQAGPFFVDPLLPEFAEKFLHHKDVFQALAPHDLNGFADANLNYFLDITALIENDCLRELHRNLFFSTSRMWLIQLPLVDWQETMQSVDEEVQDVIRAIQFADGDRLGYVMRNSMAVNLRRFLAVRHNMGG